MLDRKRLRKGDIFQILTQQGVCYGQYLYRDKELDYVTAVFRDFGDPLTGRKDDFDIYVQQEPQFIMGFPLQTAINRGLFALVGNTPVPSHLDKKFIFRSSSNFGSDNATWWFWDGETTTRIDRPLTEEEKKYPQRSILAAANVLRYIDKNWRVEIDYI